MRVTTGSSYLVTARNLGTALERASDLQGQVASGKRISTWSDDAPAASASEAYRAQEADLVSFRRSADDAGGWLSSADGTLQSMSSLLGRVRELATSAQNGALADSSRTAIADELDELREQLRDLGNTQHLGRSLFGGFAREALASDGDGAVAFTGDAGRIQRQVSPTIVLDVNVDGAALFGFGTEGGDVFATLQAMSQAVRGRDGTALAGLQGRLGEHVTAVGRGLAFVGATVNRVEAASAAGAVSLDRLAERRSALEEVDLAEAVLALNQAQSGYQAALAAAAKADLPTLADFLK